MTDTDNRALQAKEKSALKSATEETRPGPIFTPSVDISETDKALTLLADMPGVTAKDLNIDLKEGVLTLSSSVASQEGPGEIDVFSEYQTDNYYRKFNLSDVIDQSKIEATAPRRIEVKAG